MHVYFSGIGGAGIGPLAEIAHAAGYQVSGSDKRDSSYIAYLKKHGISNIHIGQTAEAIAAAHAKKQIDWFVHTSALTLEDPNPPELKFCKDNGIRVSKRDELLNEIITDKKLKLVAVAGTHGKTTTTAMVVWLFQQLKVPVSYALPAKTSFADMGHYDPKSEYFVYECDEFDRNFLAFEPRLSLITGVSWDHQEIFPTREDYQAAFVEFMNQSDKVVAWQDDVDYLNYQARPGDKVLHPEQTKAAMIKLKGLYNRLDARLALEGMYQLGFIEGKVPKVKSFELINDFPGLQRRMERIAPNLYSDYAHTPEKIRGAMSAALETAAEQNQPLVVIYEPLTNRRQHYMIDEYKDCFAGAEHVYWVPSYLAREDPYQYVLPPEELISHLSDPSIASPAKPDEHLKKQIQKHLADGAMVVGIAGGGGGSLDDWLRQEFA
jgi:UDP-N-acetylmuramate--alanine ligase